MKTHFLFPASFRNVGWILFIPALMAAIFLSAANLGIDDYITGKAFAIVNSDLSEPEYFTVIQNGLSDEIILIMLLCGGLFIGFSKQRDEDELIHQIRYESLVWAVYFNVAIMIFCTLFIYGFGYLNVMMANLFSLLLFFIIRFQIMLYKLKKSAQHEE